MKPFAFASTSDAFAAPLSLISCAVIIVVAAGTSRSRFFVRVAVTTVSPRACVATSSPADTSASTVSAA